MTPLAFRSHLKSSFIGAAVVVAPRKFASPSSSMIVRKVFSWRKSVSTFTPGIIFGPITVVETLPISETP